MTRLGDVLRLERREIQPIGDTEYPMLGIYSHGKGTFRKESILGANAPQAGLYQVRTGDFVLNITFAWEGAVALIQAEDDGWFVSGRFPTFVADHARCNARYLRYYFRTRQGQSQLVQISPGSAGRNRVLSIGRFLDLEIPVLPLEEQRRLVGRIEELAGRIEAAQELRRASMAQLHVFVASCINRMLAGVGIEGYLCDVLAEKPRNGWSPNCDNDPEGIPVLSLSAVTGFEYNERGFKRTVEPTVEGAHYWLSAGDILITRSNSPELVGHAAIYNGCPQPCIYPDLMMKLVVDPAKADSRFVHRWLMSSMVRAYIASRATGTSPTMKKISQGIVMSIPFPVSLSPAEQRRIVDDMIHLQARVDAVKQLQEQTAGELDALLPAVLERAFSGAL